VHRIPNGANNLLIDNGSNIPFFSECALVSKENWSGFDSAIRRFESSRPSQLIGLRFLPFSVRSFSPSWERSWENFVLLLISTHPVPIQFGNRVAGDLCITRQIMLGQDRLHVAGLVASDRINFDLVASGSRQRHHGGATQIVKRQPTDSRSHGGLAPRALKSAFAPRLAVAVGEHDRTFARCRVERILQRIGHRNRNVSAGLSLAQLDHGAVIRRPRQAQQIALPLSGVDGEKHRQPQIGRGGAQEARHLFVVPNLAGAGAVIELARLGARVV